MEQNTKSDKPLSHSEVTRSFLNGLDPDGDYISQYGVLGMKWGVRKDRRTLSRNSRVGDTIDVDGKKHTVSKVKKNKGSTKVTISRDMTDAELRDRIARIKMEQELTRLLTPPPKKGRKFVMEILEQSGKQILTKNAVAGGVYLSGKLAGKLVGDDLERLISGGKKKNENKD